TLGYRLQKFAHRYKALVAALSVVVILLLIGIATTTSQAVRAIKAERDALDQRDAAEKRERELWRQAYPANMMAAQRAWQRGNPKQARELLALYEPQEGREELRGFEWYYLQNLCGTTPAEDFTFSPHEKTVFCVTYSSDGALLATSSSDKTARIWNAASGKLLH